MDSTESIGEFFHKKKEAKKKQKTKGQLPIEQLDNSTIGKGSTHEQETQGYKTQEASSTQDNRTDVKSRSRSQIKNVEIDEYLFQLIIEGMIDEQFIAYYAKACHELGITTLNRLKINSLNGDDKKRLFAYKVAGALKLHYKRQFFSEKPSH